MYKSMDVAKRIKTVSHQKKIQIKNMLLDLNINKNTLSNMYNGSMLKSDSLARIADYLDCSVDFLLGRTDNPNVNRDVDESNIRSVRLYNISDADDINKIECQNILIPDTAENEPADCAIKINHSDLKPILNDNDVVLVDREPFIEDGNLCVLLLEKQFYAVKYDNQTFPNPVFLIGKIIGIYKGE